MARISNNELDRFKGEYYRDGQKVVGIWGGEAVQLLGLSGKVFFTL